MRTWNAQSFGNEQALDWLSDLLDEEDVYFIHNTLEIIADYPAGQGPDSWDCHCALAAAEMVAAVKGNPPEEFPVGAKKWLQANKLDVDEELMGLAQKAIQRIESSSELKNLWDEKSDSSEWYAALSDLRTRLGF